MRLDEAFIEFLIADDKDAAYQRLLRLLGVPEGAEDPEKARQLLQDGHLKSPKNWRSFDFLQAAARRQLAKNGEYTFNKIPQSAKLFFEMIGTDRLRGARILDLGCGAFDPLLQAVYLVCNGAGHVVAIDTQPCATPDRAAFAMANLIGEIMLAPDRWSLGAISPSEIRSRAGRFNVKALRDGNLEKGIKAAPVSYQIGAVQELCVKPGSFDIVLSFSVIEHIMEPEKILRHVANLLKPGAALVGQVDFSDHRQQALPGFNFWTFMTNRGPDQPGINELRFSELLQLLASIGLRVTKTTPTRIAMPEPVFQDLKPRFAAMKRDDLETVATYFAAVKPAGRMNLERWRRLKNRGHAILRDRLPRRLRRR
jgi:SAM-dependent methyltransferase